MAKRMEEWLEADVRPYRDRSVAWLSQYHFFRDPIRPTYADTRLFFSPADGILVYQREAGPADPLVRIKGEAYTLRDALRQPDFNRKCLVIGIFMTFFDVHVNRIPYPGQLSFRELDPIDTYNHPMLPVESGILDELRIEHDAFDFLHPNQRMVNRIWSSFLDDAYYVLQIADYDVDCITPFWTKQHQPVLQGMRFSMVRYGSQVDLIVPLHRRWQYRFLEETGSHVEAGIDALIQLSPEPSLAP